MIQIFVFLRFKSDSDNLRFKSDHDLHRVILDLNRILNPECDLNHVVDLNRATTGWRCRLPEGVDPSNNGSRACAT